MFESFFSRMKNGLIMTGLSIGYMFKHPKLLLFPLLRVLLYATAFPLLFFILNQLSIFSFLAESDKHGWVVYLCAAFIIYCVVYLFILIRLFCAVAAIRYLVHLFEFKQSSFFSSIGVALKRLPTLFLWTAVFSTAHIILRMLQDKKSNSAWLRSLAAIIEFGWHIATYFVPVFIAEQRLSFRKTINSSFDLMKKRFGEVVGIAVSFDIIAWLIFPGIIMGMLTIMKFLQNAEKAKRWTIDLFEYPAVLYAFAITFLITLILRTIISTSQDIFKAAAYNYATDKPTGPFSRELIDESFERR